MGKGRVIHIDENTYILMGRLSRLMFKGQRGASTKNRRIRKKYIQRTITRLLIDSLFKEKNNDNA